MGLIEVLFDPETGGTERVAESLSSDALGQLWKIICEDDAVSIVADKGDGKVGLIGAGRWTGKGIGQRYAMGDPIDERSWGKIEHALRCAFAGPAAGGAAGSGGKDRRSGWWALAAAGVALAGTIVSWQAMPPGDGVALAVTIALAVVTLGLVIYGGIGLGTRCPSCRAWYRRETTSTDMLGTSTVSRTISKPVHDSSGKQTGTTSELATYERTNYRYHYRCKECSHRWTGTGSSERRIS